MKVIIWGAGGKAKNFLNKKSYYKNMEIVAMVDNNPEHWGKNFIRGGYIIISPDAIKDYEYDKILICCLAIEEVSHQLIEEMHIPKEKIFTWIDVDNEVAQSLIKKYETSSDDEIQKVVQYYSKNGLNVFGSYRAEKDEFYQVKRDKDDMPYVLFEGKRMYYPKSFAFEKLNGQEYVKNILQEQGDHSPHLYLRKGTSIKENSVIVDAGVCEGNFALRYVEKAKKIYLIEADPEWIQALERTFSDYKEKVVLCDKFLTRYESEHTITLDELIQEEIDFLKMDIEGAEVDALLGGKNILKASNAVCAVCSYHVKNDEENIRYLLESFGYKTSTSEGYMFYPYDDNILDTLDLRKGIVYATKQNYTGT